MDRLGLQWQYEAMEASSWKDNRTPIKAEHNSRSGSRRTRSQGVPDWSEEETLILVGQVAAVDDGWTKTFSSYQRWKMISENCMGLGVNRPSNQYKRKWEALVSDFQKIKDWLSSEGGSYWSMDFDRRKELGLPPSFFEEVFGLMDAILNTKMDRPVSRCSEKEEATAEIEILESDVSGSGHKEQLPDKTRKDMICVQDKADKLRESAEHVHVLLGGEVTIGTNRTRSPVDLLMPNATEIEFTRRQADELISTLGTMVSTLNQLTELIKDVRSK